MIEDITKDTKARMAKTVEALAHDLAKVRTGRAHPSLLDQIMVSYYGTEVPINQVANVSAEDARTLTVTPWEQKMVATVDKAIRISDLGLNLSPSEFLDMIKEYQAINPPLFIFTYGKYLVILMFLFSLCVFVIMQHLCLVKLHKGLVKLLQACLG